MTTINERVKEYLDIHEEAYPSEMVDLPQFEDLSYMQIKNAVSRVRDPERDRRYNRENPNYMLWRNAKRRALAKNIYFDLNKEHIVIPMICPILKIPMFSSVGLRGGGPASPTIDRIDPRKGYTKDNIHVICKRANTIKSNATPEELKLICDWITTYWLSKME